jgi:hypothetical protein
MVDQIVVSLDVTYHCGKFKARAGTLRNVSLAVSVSEDGRSVFGVVSRMDLGYDELEPLRRILSTHGVSERVVLDPEDPSRGQWILEFATDTVRTSFTLKEEIVQAINRISGLYVEAFLETKRAMVRVQIACSDDVRKKTDEVLGLIESMERVHHGSIAAHSRAHQYMNQCRVLAGQLDAARMRTAFVESTHGILVEKVANSMTFLSDTFLVHGANEDK